MTTADSMGPEPWPSAPGPAGAATGAPNAIGALAMEIGPAPAGAPKSMARLGALVVGGRSVMPSS